MIQWNSISNSIAGIQIIHNSHNSKILKSDHDQTITEPNSTHPTDRKSLNYKCQTNIPNYLSWNMSLYSPICYCKPYNKHPVHHKSRFGITTLDQCTSIYFNSWHCFVHIWMLYTNVICLILARSASISEKYPNGFNERMTQEDINMQQNDYSTYSLLIAVCEGKLKKTQDIILGLSHRLTEWEGYNILCEAVVNNHTSIVELLTTHGYPANDKSKDRSFTPLHFAVKNDNVKIVKMLLEKGADINAENQIGSTSLDIAIEKENIEIIKLLLQKGARVGNNDPGIFTPLHNAVNQKSLKIVELLLKYGANINFVCCGLFDAKYTPLCIAVEFGYRQMVELLLKKGADVHAQGRDCGSVLALAVEKNDVQIVELLLKYGADVHAVNKHHKTLINTAVYREYENIVQLLLEYGADVNTYDSPTILHVAVSNENLKIVETILKHNPNLNDPNNGEVFNTAIYAHGKSSQEIVKKLIQYGFTVNPEDVNNSKLMYSAVENGHLEVVEELLKLGTRVDLSHNINKSLTPLLVAIQNKRENIAKLLITHGSDINAKDDTGKPAIFYAISNGYTKITKQILKNGGNIKEYPELLNIAVEKDNIKIVEILLENGMDINFIDGDGRSPLHFVAMDEHVYDCPLNIHDCQEMKERITLLLLSKGANVNSRSKTGVTTLHRAVRLGYIDIVKALLKYNADVNARLKNDDFTPLHIAAYNSRIEICKLLLDHGALVNAGNKDGKTSFHLAVLQRHTTIMIMLLKHGAKINDPIEDGVTPLYHAAQQSNLEVVEVLLKYGAEINSQDHLGKTALHVAAETGHTRMIKTLLQHNADINITNDSNHTPLASALDGTNLYSNERNDYNSDDEIFDCDEVIEILSEHIVKLKTANFYVNERNLQLICNNKQISNFQEQCVKEIAIMKKTQLEDSNILLYNILINDTNQSAKYMRNKSVVETLKLGTLFYDLPIYRSIIEMRVEKCIERKELLELGRNNSYLISNYFFQLPYVCAEQIFSYLSNDDLKVFIEACKLS